MNKVLRQFLDSLVINDDTPPEVLRLLIRLDPKQRERAVWSLWDRATPSDFAMIAEYVPAHRSDALDALMGSMPSEWDIVTALAVSDSVERTGLLLLYLEDISSRFTLPTSVLVTLVLSDDDMTKNWASSRLRPRLEKPDDEVLDALADNPVITRMVSDEMYGEFMKDFDYFMTDLSRPVE